MKLFKHIKNVAMRVSKKTLVVAASILTVGALGAGYVQAEFYPDRPVYDYNKGSATSNCADPNDPGYSGGRCGSLNGPVFNSFINTPSYGDERAFADASRTDQTASGSYKNTVTDVTSGSKELVIRTYVHNNANQSDNASGKAIAKDTKVKVLLPTGTSNGLRARSYISASNAAMVEDTVDFTAPENFKLEYVPGSATLVNSGFRNGVKLSDSIVTDGALIGSNALDGNLKGCFDYTSVVEIHVKVIPEAKPKVDFTKQVAVTGSTAWGETVTTKPGDTVKWLINFKNTGTSDLTSVNISDKLPPHLTVVPGSVKYTDASATTVQGDTPLFGTGGIGFGTWKPNGGFYVRFDTVAKDDFEGCEVNLRNIAYNMSAQTPKVEDSADVVIKKENCNLPAKIVTCDALTAPKLALKTGESTVFTATGSQTNTSITGYIFKVNGAVVQDSAANTYSFTQGAEGTYTVEVTVKSPIGNVTSEACAKTVVVKNEVVPVYTCDALTFNKTNLLSGDKLISTVRYTALSGATFKQATFNFGDSSTYTTNNSTNNTATAEHTYKAKNTYAVTVKLEFLVNGETKSVEGGKCIGQVTVSNEKCPIPGKEQYEKNDTVNCNDVKGVTTIPNTGAGSMFGLFAAVTAAGAFLHSVWVRRMVNR